MKTSFIVGSTVLLWSPYMWKRDTCLSKAPSQNWWCHKNTPEGYEKFLTHIWGFLGNARQVSTRSKKKKNGSKESGNETGFRAFCMVGRWLWVRVPIETGASVLGTSLSGAKGGCTWAGITPFVQPGAKQKGERTVGWHQDKPQNWRVRLLCHCTVLGISLIQHCVLYG